MRTHRPLTYVLLCFSAGILIGQNSTLPFIFLLMATGIFLGASLLFIRRKIISQIFLCISFVLLGTICIRNHSAIAKNDICKVARYYRSQPVVIEGVVVSEAKRSNFFKGRKTTVTLHVKQFKTRWGWKAKTGKILLNIFRDCDLSYGDYVRVEGKLHEPFNFASDNVFSYKKYLKHHGIQLILSVKKKGYVEILSQTRANIIKSSALRVKQFLKNILARNLTENEAGIMQAILLGDRSNIPTHIRELFIQTGTAHILAISGLHVGIVAFLIFMIFKMMPINRKMACLLTIFFLMFYAFLTGGRPSVIRATIMASIFIGSFIIERETDLVNSLSLAALVILAFNPFNFFDIGFQLSFSSVLAIICIYPQVVRIIGKYKIYQFSKAARFIFNSFAVSFAAWIGVAGLLAYYFRIITPIAVIANLLIVPCVTIIVIIGFCLLLIGSFIPYFAFIVAYCVKGILSAMVACAYIFSKIPAAHFYITNVSTWHVIIYYIFILIIFGIPKLIKLTKHMKYGRVGA